MTVLRSFTPLVEPLSLDEAFLDVTGSRRLLGDGETIGRAIRVRVSAEEGLACSVGVAATKFVAKLASEAAKPRASLAGVEPGRGVVLVPPGSEREFLDPLPVRALWGVGPATLPRLERLGVRTIAELAALPKATLTAAFGERSGSHLYDLAHAVDSRGVEPEQRPKSVSHEETFPHDLIHDDDLVREVVRLADATAARLRRHGTTGRTVTLKVRFGDFRTITRSTTFSTPTDSGRTITRTARDLLAKVDAKSGVRLLGVAVTNLDELASHQLGLLADNDHDAAWDRAEATIDAVRSRFGDAAVVPATLAGPTGPRVKRRGDQQWGPEAG
jgi:DNA polymerase-4